MPYAARNFAYRMSPRFVRRHVFHKVMGSRTPFTTEVLDRRTIFVHVPKAAGTSVKTEVFGRATGGHWSIAQFAELDREKTDEFFKFTFVRNPWDRMLSAYSFLSQGSGRNPRSRNFVVRHVLPTPTFEGFVLRLLDEEFRDKILRFTHFRPQTEWICMPGEDQPAVDFVGRFENMAVDLAALRPLLPATGGPAATPAAAPGPAESPAVHRRSSTHLPYRDAYSPRTRDIVGELYERDVRVLSYSF